MSHSLETRDSSAMATVMQISEGQVAISIRQETSSPRSTVKQEFRAYFNFLYLMACVFMDLLTRLRVQIINQNQSPFEVNLVFMIIVVVALSVVTLTTMFMVSTSYYYIQISSLRNIHYSILRAISYFCAILAPFSLGMLLYVPRSLNWIGYTLICIILGIVVACYFATGGFVFGVEGELQENNEFPKIYYIGILVPISFVLVFFLPNNLNWVVITVIQLFFWIALLYIILAGCCGYDDFIKTTLKRSKVNPTIQEQQPSVNAVL